MRFSALLRTPVAIALRYLLSFALLAWLATRVEWARLEEWQDVDWRQGLLALLLAGSAYPLQAWRWHVLLRALDIARPASWVHGVTWIGQFYGSFLPAGVAADAVRLACICRDEPDRRAAGAASLVADRLLGLGALLALATVALANHTLRAGADATRLHAFLVVSAVAGALVFALGWTLARTRWWEPVSARVLGAERAARLHAAATALGARPRALTAAAALSVAVWLVDCVALWLLARAVGLGAGPLDMLIASTVAYLAASLPVSIGGHGVRELSLATVLAMLGHGTPGDGALALLTLSFWALTIGWSLVGGVVQLAALVRGDRSQRR